VTERLYTADYVRQQHDLLMALASRAAEPWVTVEVTDAAKGEVRVVTKVSAPLGTDPVELQKHSEYVVRLAVAAHKMNEARKEPNGG
jgi:hypothetical protein